MNLNMSSSLDKYVGIDTPFISWGTRKFCKLLSEYCTKFRTVPAEQIILNLNSYMIRVIKHIISIKDVIPIDRQRAKLLLCKFIDEMLTEEIILDSGRDSDTDTEDLFNRFMERHNNSPPFQLPIDDDNILKEIVFDESEMCSLNKSRQTLGLDSLPMNELNSSSISGISYFNTIHKCRDGMACFFLSLFYLIHKCKSFEELNTPERLDELSCARRDIGGDKLGHLFDTAEFHDPLFDYCTKHNFGIWFCVSSQNDYNLHNWLFNIEYDADPDEKIVYRIRYDGTPDFSFGHYSPMAIMTMHDVRLEKTNIDIAIENNQDIKKITHVDAS